MSTTLIGIIVSAGVSLLGFWIKWKLSQAKQDRLRREDAENEAKALRDGLKANYGQNQRHEGNVIEIMRGVSDDRAGELLSRGPKAPKVSSATPPKDGDGGR